MRRALFFIFSLIILHCMQAQDSLNVKPRVLAISGYIDYGKLAFSFLDFESKYAGGVDLVFFSHYLITGEYGIATLNPNEAYENVDYTSEGSYFKAGVGYIGKFKETYKMGIGFRYGESRFEDRGTITVSSSSPLVGDYTESFRRTNLTGNWVEVFFLSESQLRLAKKNPSSLLNRLFSIGFTAQLRKLLDYTSFTPVDVYNIPGYGRSIDNSIPAVNVFLKINVIK